jgi:hypothetical protein
LAVYPPDMPLDWVLDSDEDEDPSLAILDAIEEHFFQSKGYASKDQRLEEAEESEKLH